MATENRKENRVEGGGGGEQALSFQGASFALNLCWSNCALLFPERIQIPAILPQYFHE